MIELYINDKKLDLTSDISILQQKQRTDYTNPTIIRNSFTKTINVPGTANNNLIFGNIWKLDRRQQDAVDTDYEYGYYMGIVSNFNPSHREPFKLVKDGNLLESGYVKLDKIYNSNSKISYDITLYGELGNLLYGLTYKPSVDVDDREVRSDVYDEVVSLTLGDLDYQLPQATGGRIDFIIDKTHIIDAWDNLHNLDQNNSPYDTINFAVCNNGIPKANRFDPTKVMVSTKGADTNTRVGAVTWVDTDYPPNSYPQGKTVDGTYYGYISTFIARYDPDDHYGLLELKKGITDVEARDLRSYLQRPIIRLKKVFEAIGRYMSTNLGYTLDISDNFFTEKEFTNAWITLPMLYEIYPEVESYTQIKQEQLLSKTGTPASYLISYCKTYGLYLDIDIINKVLKLIPATNFFDKFERNDWGEILLSESEVNHLDIDVEAEKKIEPLTFDKSSYTFDYEPGEGYFLDKYLSEYNSNYGTKKVNTGYRFGNETAPYIDNNIFRTAVDAIEQSPYFHYNVSTRTIPTSEFPIALPAAVVGAEEPEYKYFHVDQTDHYPVYNQDGSCDTYGGTFKMGPGSGTSVINDWGYMYQSNKWNGLQKGVWQDAFSRLSFHDAENNPVDGSNVLVWFNGFGTTTAGDLNSFASTESETRSENTLWYDIITSSGRGTPKYLVSDDQYLVNKLLGCNCYFDNPSPDNVYMGNNYLTQISEVPLFNHVEMKYVNTDIIPYERHSSWGTAGWSATGTGASLSYGIQTLKVTGLPSEYPNRPQSYISVPIGQIAPTPLTPTPSGLEAEQYINYELYFIMKFIVQDYSGSVTPSFYAQLYDTVNQRYLHNDTNAGYSYAKFDYIIPCPTHSKDWKLGIARFTVPEYYWNGTMSDPEWFSGQAELRISCRSFNIGDPVDFDIAWISAINYSRVLYGDDSHIKDALWYSRSRDHYDPDVFRTSGNLLKYMFETFHYNNFYNSGVPYFQSKTLDFGVPREIYMPATTVPYDSDLYYRYWRNFITDLYNINSRVLECTVRLDNIQDDAFRKMYFYDNCFWVLSSVEDWDEETKKCKGKFIKVNHIYNYIFNNEDKMYYSPYYP